jgi:hypothetical protein
VTYTRTIGVVAVKLTRVLHPRRGGLPVQIKVKLLSLTPQQAVDAEALKIRSRGEKNSLGVASREETA